MQLKLILIKKRSEIQFLNQVDSRSFRVSFQSNELLKRIYHIHKVFDKKRRKKENIYSKVKINIFNISVHIH